MAPIGSPPSPWLSALRSATSRLRSATLRADRRERAQRRRDFERDTLLDLQDWLAKLASATGSIHHQTEMEFRREGTWGRVKLGEDLNLAEQEAVGNAQRLRVRINDEAIRNATKEFVATCVSRRRTS